MPNLWAQLVGHGWNFDINPSRAAVAKVETRSFYQRIQAETDISFAKVSISPIRHLNGRF